MQLVRSRGELDAIIDSKRGYIVNERGDRVKLHRATCDYVIVSWPDRYTKYFFSDVGEAKHWANEKYGDYPHGWSGCGQCHPFDMPAFEMPTFQNQCQRDGCKKPGDLRSFVDNTQNCVWRFWLCDECDQLLQDHEKLAVARAKGSRSPS
jgi:hypothetical protein